MHTHNKQRCHHFHRSGITVYQTDQMYRIYHDHHHPSSVSNNTAKQQRAAAAAPPSQAPPRLPLAARARPRPRPPPRAPAAPRAGASRPFPRQRGGFAAAHDAARGLDQPPQRSRLRSKPPPWGCRASAARAVTSSCFCRTRLRSAAPHPMRSTFPLFPLACDAGATRAAPLRNPGGSALPAVRRRGGPRAPFCPLATKKPRHAVENGHATASRGCRKVVTAPSGARAPRRANVRLFWAPRATAGLPPPRPRGTGTRPPGSVADGPTAGVVSPPWCTSDTLRRRRRAAGPAICAGEVASGPLRRPAGPPPPLPCEAWWSRRRGGGAPREGRNSTTERREGPSFAFNSPRRKAAAPPRGVGEGAAGAA
jgi:hypothetical protein